MHAKTVFPLTLLGLLTTGCGRSHALVPHDGAPDARSGDADASLSNDSTTGRDIGPMMDMRSSENDASVDGSQADGVGDGIDAQGDETSSAVLVEMVTPQQFATAGPSLVDYGAGVGTAGSGWDLCVSPTPYELGSKCSTCSGSPDKADFLVYQGSQASAMSASPGPQAYVYLSGPIASGSDLWFDIALEAGGVSDTAMTLYSVDSGCNVQSTLGTFQLRTVVADTSVWQSMCLRVRESDHIDGIGFRFDGRATVGLSAFHAGPMCP